MIKLLKWLIGVGVLVLIPVVFPIAILLTVVYYIPVTIGGWIYELVERWIKE